MSLYFLLFTGSSVATSLSEGEAKQKQVGVLYVKGMDLKMERFPLQTVRPFIFRRIFLSDAPDDLTTASANTEKKVVIYFIF
jgi:double-strand break repair protein MRE11